uniref:Putative secreted protein n=1 Tax=Ixodes ricinus TaxID=34613 RepID=A0A6B0TZG6_IXORI
MISSTFFVVSICLFLVSATCADDIGKVDSYTALVGTFPIGGCIDRPSRSEPDAAALFQRKAKLLVTVELLATGDM